MTHPASYSIIALPAFSDNYIWVLHSDRHAAVIDPGDAGPVIEYLSTHALRLAAILVTHHHADHIGGISELLRLGPVPVLGPAGEPAVPVTRALRAGAPAAIPEIGASLQVIEVPGHTRTHLAYYEGTALFCGDTLFGCGCGRLFEGTPAQMLESLTRLAMLPPDTRVHCAHEYTLANIRFARTVEPGNHALEERERAAARVRRENRPTVPSTMELERATNPFLRCAEPEVAETAKRFLGRPATDTVEVFAAIRRLKDGFQ